MNYIDEIFKRMDIRHIGAFLLNGEGNPIGDGKSYKKTLKTACEPIHKRLENIYHDKEELNRALAELYKAFNAYEEVFMELGIKAGARILNQLMYENGDNGQGDTSQ